MLSEWASPSPRDKVLGLYRPLDARDASVASTALSENFAGLMQDESTRVRIASIDAAAGLNLNSQGGRLAELVGDLNAEGNVRAAALKALAKMQAREFEDALAVAKADFDPHVRRASVLVTSMSSSGAAAPELAKVLKTGSLEEKQIALAGLAQIPGTLADEIVYRMFRPWIEGESLDPRLELDVLEASRARPDQRFEEFLELYEQSIADGERNQFHWAMNGGNAENGKKVFVEHAAAACYRCHAVEGGGGDVGPAMDGIAARLSPDQVLESIVNPNATIAEGFENQLIEMNNGDYFAGIIKSETDSEIVLNSPEDGILTLAKAEVKSRARGASGMPEGLPDILSKSELRDLMAYLLNLK